VQPQVQNRLIVSHYRNKPIQFIQQSQLVIYPTLEGGAIAFLYAIINLKAFQKQNPNAKQLDPE